MKILHAALTVHLLLIAPLVSILAYFASNGHFILQSTLSHKLATLWTEGEPFTWMGIIAAPMAFTLSRLTTRQPVRIPGRSPAYLRRKSKPPLNAEFLFWFFLDDKNCDAVVGDLEESYRLRLKKFGKGKADSWYWKQALNSVGPIAWAWAKKFVLRPLIILLVWLEGKTVFGDSLVASLIELWRRP